MGNRHGIKFGQTTTLQSEGAKGTIFTFGRLSGRALEFLQHIPPYPLRRRNLIMTPFLAGAGAVLQNISRQNAPNLENKAHKLELDMEYTLVLGSNRHLKDFTKESGQDGLLFEANETLQHKCAEPRALKGRQVCFKMH